MRLKIAEIQIICELRRADAEEFDGILTVEEVAYPHRVAAYNKKGS